MAEGGGGARGRDETATKREEERRGVCVCVCRGGLRKATFLENLKKKKNFQRLTYREEKI